MTQRCKYRDIYSPAILLEGRARHFDREYIIKLSKKNFVPYQLNLMLNLDHGLALFRQTQTLRKQKQGSQQVSYPLFFLSQLWQKLYIHLMKVCLILSEQE